ncbi:MAG TPA: porphobilinogen synthase [Elusimicrobia bacterium]|jgi:porphobilinogen synthase|nr:porphobilinogen synthase [Elusimicrobiota bacterium]
MSFPEYRPRRMRKNENLRRLIRETRLSVDNLVMPYFVRPGRNVKKEISSMPGNFQWSIDNLVKEIREVKESGIPAVILFGIPEKKDERGSGAYTKNGIIQQAVKAVKDKVPELVVITDLCLCEYMSHGHCGVVRKIPNPKSQIPNYIINNDATLEILARTAVSQAEAGADIIAPSGMMDGQVKAIRQGLDENNFTDIPIMAYSAKYASAFYGPFREAAESPPQFGDRRAYQMDIANWEEALREIALDLEEGADIIMIKPALAYLDIIRLVKDKFHYPVAAYDVSGEFSMVKAASKKGWLEEEKIIFEILTAIKRAGADIILTYFAKEVAKKLGT